MVEITLRPEIAELFQTDMSHIIPYISILCALYILIFAISIYESRKNSEGIVILSSLLCRMASTVIIVIFQIDIRMIFLTLCISPDVYFKIYSMFKRKVTKNNLQERS